MVAGAMSLALAVVVVDDDARFRGPSSSSEVASASAAIATRVATNSVASDAVAPRDSGAGIRRARLRPRAAISKQGSRSRGLTVMVQVRTRVVAEGTGGSTAIESTGCGRAREQCSGHTGAEVVAGNTPSACHRSNRLVGAARCLDCYSRTARASLPSTSEPRSNSRSTRRVDRAGRAA